MPANMYRQRITLKETRILNALLLVYCHFTQLCITQSQVCSWRTTQRNHANRFGLILTNHVGDTLAVKCLQVLEQSHLIAFVIAFSWYQWKGLSLFSYLGQQSVQSCYGVSSVYIKLLNRWITTATWIRIIMLWINLSGLQNIHLRRWVKLVYSQLYIGNNGLIRYLFAYTNLSTGDVSHLSFFCMAWRHFQT